MPRARHRRLVTVLTLAAMALPTLVPATVEEQRARLPPPAACTDPIEGVWQAHRYNPPWGDWMIYTLTLHRAASGSVSLTGGLSAHSWTGGPEQSMPPPCGPGILHWIVTMDTHGRYDEATHAIDVQADAWRIQSVLCLPWANYRPDHFTGTVDPAAQEFISVNNDGGRAVNEPVLFRRINCLDDLGHTHAVIAPPPLVPPHHAGCGR